jgi:excinuclease ABC subunit C
MENQAPRAALLDLAHEASTSPGVYLMKDAGGGVLYVGKAKNLKNRLTTYFQPAIHDVPRTEMLVNRVTRFELILTETESEALILEATLIKKHKPKFNVRLKDDKNYPYLKIAIDQDFPRIEWTRRVVRDGARYFGPFPSAWAARQVMQMLTETFHLRDCSDNTFRHRTRPCILFQIDKCSGSCVGHETRDEYKETIGQVVAVLEGKTQELVENLKHQMQEAAVKEDFEFAAYCRDMIHNLELITETQSVIYAEDTRDRDVIGVARAEGPMGVSAHGTILRVRGGRLISVQHYDLQNTDSSQSEAELVGDFVSQYYLNMTPRPKDPEIHSEPTYENERPSEVLVPVIPADMDLIEKTLGIGFRVADLGSGAGAAGAVDQQLLNVARTNAKYALEQNLKRNVGHGIQALEEIQEKLHLPKLPQRIECYDISNIQGQDTVASRVAFVDGAPEKSLYRRYKIRTVEGSNDFASMKEVLGRRFAHVEEQFPDLVVVDGGKGQLAQAVAIMEELGISGVAVVGLAKARTESDFQAKEVKSSLERVFIPGRKNPVPLLPNTAAYKLLVHVRDEAHRFAITYHRLVRSKRSLRSEDGS